MGEGGGGAPGGEVVRVHANFIRPIARDVRRIVRRIVNAGVRAANDLLDIRHDLPVNVAPTPVIADGHGGCGFGVFVATPEGKCSIWLGGDPPEEADDRAMFLLTTLAHELCHYIQFRDGKALTERGVEVRSRNLAQRFAAALTVGR